MRLRKPNHSICRLGKFLAESIGHNSVHRLNLGIIFIHFGCKLVNGVLATVIDIKPIGDYVVALHEYVEEQKEKYFFIPMIIM